MKKKGNIIKEEEVFKIRKSKDEISEFPDYMEIEKRIKSIKTNPHPEYLLLFVAVLLISLAINFTRKMEPFYLTRHYIGIIFCIVIIIGVIIEIIIRWR